MNWILKKMADMLTPQGVEQIAKKYVEDEQLLTGAKIGAFGEIYTEALRSNNEVYILCAATWFNDGKAYMHQPINIERGLVFCGWGHHTIFQQIGGTVGERQKLGIHMVDEGFLTSNNRWVTRKEAAKIAYAAGQIKEPKNELYSEDLRAN